MPTGSRSIFGAAGRGVRTSQSERAPSRETTGTVQGGQAEVGVVVPPVVVRRQKDAERHRRASGRNHGRHRVQHHGRKAVVAVAAAAAVVAAAGVGRKGSRRGC